MTTTQDTQDENSNFSVYLNSLVAITVLKCQPEHSSAATLWQIFLASLLKNHSLTRRLFLFSPIRPVSPVRLRHSAASACSFPHDSTPITPAASLLWLALSLQPTALRSGIGYRGLTAFASLSLAVSAGSGLVKVEMRIEATTKNAVIIGAVKRND